MNQQQSVYWNSTKSSELIVSFSDLRLDQVFGVSGSIFSHYYTINFKKLVIHNPLFSCEVIENRELNWSLHSWNVNTL